MNKQSILQAYERHLKHIHPSVAVLGLMTALVVGGINIYDAMNNESQAVFRKAPTEIIKTTTYPTTGMNANVCLSKSVQSQSGSIVTFAIKVRNSGYSLGSGTVSTGIIAPLTSNFFRIVDFIDISKFDLLSCTYLSGGQQQSCLNNTMMPQPFMEFYSLPVGTDVMMTLTARVKSTTPQSLTNTATFYYGQTSNPITMQSCGTGSNPIGSTSTTITLPNPLFTGTITTGSVSTGCITSGQVYLQTIYNADHVEYVQTTGARLYEGKLYNTSNNPVRINSMNYKLQGVLTNVNSFVVYASVDLDTSARYSSLGVQISIPFSATIPANSFKTIKYSTDLPINMLANETIGGKLITINAIDSLCSNQVTVGGAPANFAQITAVNH